MYHKSKKQTSKKSYRKSKPRKSVKFSKKSKSIKPKAPKRKTRRHTKRQSGGDGYLLDIFGPKVGGLPQNYRYSSCCPPLYQDGKIAFDGKGNQMCGGNRKRKIYKKRK